MPGQPRDPIRSLLLTAEFPPQDGGVPHVLGAIARHWPAGHLVVSTGEVPGAAAADALLPNRVDRLGVSARRLRTLAGVLMWSRRAVGLGRELRPEFVWCGTMRPAAQPAKWLRERSGIPYGILVHGADLLILQHKIHQSRIKRGTARSLIGAASVLVANSHWTRDLCDALLSEAGIDPSPGRVRVVPLGTDPDQFRPGLPTDTIRDRYQLGPGRWLLTVAQLGPHRGVDTTLKALGRLAPDLPDLRYAVVAAGDREAELSALARGLGVADRVRFLPAVPEADLPALYNCASVYVGVSRQAGLAVDGFSVSLLEASAVGIPVVGGRSGGVPDAVREGETGLLVEPEDSAGLAEALRRLLAGPELAGRLGAAGRRAVESYFNWNRVVADLVAISTEFSIERSPVPPR